MMLCHPDHRHEEAIRMADKERLLPNVMHPGACWDSKRIKRFSVEGDVHKDTEFGKMY
jgi:hypothetical protein